MPATLSLTAHHLRGTFAQAGQVRDINLCLRGGDLVVVTSAEERPRRNLLRLLSGHSPIVSGSLVYDDGDEQVDLATASARDMAWIRARRIACTVTMPQPIPSLSCEAAISELAGCTEEEAVAELSALAHDHAVGLAVADARGSARTALLAVAALLHPAPIVMVDLGNLVTVDILERLRARARNGDAVLVTTDSLVDGLPAGSATCYLSTEGHLLET